MIFAAAPASAATCSRSEAQQGLYLLNKADSSVRRFSNAPIRTFCASAAKMQKDMRKADAWLQSHKQCTTSAAQRRSVRTFHSQWLKINRAIRNACGH